MISPIDLGLGLVAVLTLVHVARRPHPVRPTTAILLTLLTGVLLWANLRDSGWHAVWNEDAPEGLDPVTKAMFYRGWPLAPFNFCLVHGLRFHPSGLEQCVLALDGVVFLVALFTTKAACEPLLAWRRRRDLGRISTE
jgi:hypothetical protein